MEIAYAAYTESATFMLDAKGIVLWVAPSPSAQGTGEMWRGREAADRCVGAQYVASVDMEAAGGLIELPKIGSPLIFAAVDEAGRVSLLRSGPLLRFEAKSRRTSGVHSRPSARTPIAETGNPYEDEVATVKYHPRDLMYAATSAKARVDAAQQLSERPTPVVKPVINPLSIPTPLVNPPILSQMKMPTRRVPPPLPGSARLAYARSYS